MKTYLIIAMAAVVLIEIGVLAQNATPEATARDPEPSASRNVAAPLLSGGATEVLKLSRAQVGDSLILTYLSTWRAKCALSVPELIYLKQQGVTEPVLAAMLRHDPTDANALAPAVPQPAPVAAPSAATAQAQSPQQPAPVYAAPTAIYAAPLTAHAVPTTTYMISSPAPTYYYYPRAYYNSYYYPYCSLPSVSLSFGFGRGYRGAYCGGWRWGGCWRGGRR